MGDSIMTHPIAPYPAGYSGPPYGPTFDGRHLHNMTNNPYLNTLFEGVNATQDMIEFAPIGGPPGGMTANQAFLFNFIDPLVNTAGGHYRAGLETAYGNRDQGGGGGIVGNLIRGAGDVAGGIIRLPGQVLGTPFRWLGLDFVADVLEAPGNLIGGLVEGITDVVGGVVDFILPF